MNLKSFAGGMLVAVFLIGALGQIGVSADRMSASDTLSIPAETVAGYVHAIIQADRATYTTQIVDRMQLRGITVASENWEQRGTLPLPVPAEMVTSSTADVGGVQATVLSSRNGLFAGVVWVRDGVMTGVAGSLSADELLTVARGLR